ncbi:MAG: cation:proton antiporter [Alphaproteobacteria bacterium]|nr:cation:proton antiporter [Alphaproteobacteria bacterium]
MHGLHPLIIDLTLITIYAAITTLVFKKLKQPTVLGYVLAGIFAGPYFDLVPTVTDKANLDLWADIGVIFLLFNLGLEFSFKKMMAVGKSAMITATLNIFLMLFVGYYIGMFLGWTTSDSFFLGSMISMSSTTIIIKAFDDLNIKKQKYTDLVFGILVIEDIVGILLLVLLPTVAIGKGINGGDLWVSVMKLLTFLILCFVCGIYLVPTALRKIKNFLTDEMLLLVSVALSLSMVYLAVYFGFSSALGAFVMGSILSETGVIHRVEKVIKPLKDFFGAVFFVTVGMMVNPEMFITYAYPIFIITMVVLIGMVIFSIFGCVISGQNLKTAVYCGFSLAQVGEFAFIIATLGMSLGVIDGFVYPIIVAVSVITTFLTPIMMKSSEKAYNILCNVLPQKWQEYIEKNTRTDKETGAEEQLWKDLFKSSFIRVFLFSFILAAIIAFSNQLIRPYALKWMPNLAARLTTTLITLLLMSPFLKGLMGGSMNLLPIKKFKFLPQELSFRNKIKLPEFNFSKTKKSAKIVNKPIGQPSKVMAVSNQIKTVIEANTDTVKNLFMGTEGRITRIYNDLWAADKSNHLPLLTLVSFRLLVMSFFIVTAVHQFLTENPKVIFIMLLATIFLITRSKWLLNQYLKIENQFLDNLNGEQQEEGKE